MNWKLKLAGRINLKQSKIFPEQGFWNQKLGKKKLRQTVKDVVVIILKTNWSNQLKKEMDKMI